MTFRRIKGLFKVQAFLFEDQEAKEDQVEEKIADKVIDRLKRYGIIKQGNIFIVFSAIFKYGGVLMTIKVYEKLKQVNNNK
jgi:hypothetical protein